MTLLSAGCAVFETVIDIRLFFFLKKYKEKTITYSLFNVLFLVLMTLSVSLSFSGGHLPVILYVMLLVCEVLVIPMLTTVVTPQGIAVAGFKSITIEPADKYSYEYKQGKVIKETLYIFDKDHERPNALHFGIKNPKLVSMLNDNYNKHDYENPMLKE